MVLMECVILSHLTFLPEAAKDAAEVADAAAEQTKNVMICLKLVETHSVGISLLSPGEHKQPTVLFVLNSLSMQTSLALLILVPFVFSSFFG